MAVFLCEERKMAGEGILEKKTNFKQNEVLTEHGLWLYFHRESIRAFG